VGQNRRQKAEATDAGTRGWGDAGETKRNEVSSFRFKFRNGSSADYTEQKAEGRRRKAEGRRQEAGLCRASVHYAQDEV